jgi:hypothetical protein
MLAGWRFKQKQRSNRMTVIKEGVFLKTPQECHGSVSGKKRKVRIDCCVGAVWWYYRYEMTYEYTLYEYNDWTQRYFCAASGLYQTEEYFKEVIENQKVYKEEERKA